MNANYPSVPIIDRRARERARKIADILEVAGERFARCGYRDTSMEDIARAAEYATGTLYRYFDSKEALYLALLKQRSIEFIALMQKHVDQHEDPIDKIVTFISKHIDLSAQDFGVLQTFFNERFDQVSSNATRLEIEDMHQDFYGWLEVLIADGQRTGIFQAGDAHLYTLMIQGLLLAVLRNWVSGSLNIDQLEDHKAFLIQSVLKLLCSPPPSCV